MLLTTAALIFSLLALPFGVDAHRKSSLSPRAALAAHKSMHKRCGAKIAARQARRSLKRSLPKAVHASPLLERTFHSFTARETNTSSACILSPDVTQGPYHVLGEKLRADIGGGQAGIPLIVQMTVVDINSCDPLVGAYVDSWHANATGIYSGYITASVASFREQLSGGSPPSGGSGPGGPAPSGSASGGAAPTGSSSSSGTGSGPVDPGAVMYSVTDEETFCRGVSATDEDGVAVQTSVLPGWYPSRSVHWHMKVYPADKGSSENSNGTFTAGTAAHTGQLFWDTATLDAAAAVWPYNTNPLAWANATKNDVDNIYVEQNTGGYSATVDSVWANSSDIRYGIVSSITIGVNLSFVSEESSSQYYDPTHTFSSSSTVSTALPTSSTSSSTTNSSFSSPSSSSTPLAAATRRFGREV